MSRTAREEFLHLLGDQDAEYIDDFLSKHAHELAEKIRADAPYGATEQVRNGCEHSADLIDPEVEG